MKHIKTLTTRDLKESMKKGGCGECQTSCQSACKTSCTVGNQNCEKLEKGAKINNILSDDNLKLWFFKNLDEAHKIAELIF